MREVERKMTQLPKNFRQVGEPKLNKRIYIEDYVVTYLTELAQPENIYARGAILLGTIKDTKEGQAIFIKGAMEAQNLELDLDETIFSNEVWAEIKERRKKYFPNLEIIGWFLSRIGFSVELNDKILRTHMENFAGENKILYMMDTLEGEDAFYFWEKGELKKSDGYYIYYEKNEQMQEYMIVYGEDSKQKTTENKETPIIKRDEDVIKSYRNMIKNKKKQKKNKKVLGRIYAAMGSCAVLVAILGFLLFSYGERKEESAMANISDILQEQSNTVEETWSEKEINNGEKEDSKLLSTEESSNDITEASTNLGQETSESENDIIDEEDLQGENSSSESETNAAKKQENSSSTEEKLEQSSSNIQEDKSELEEGMDETEETMGVAGSYYTVQPGDTLAAISNRVYESIDYVEDIAELNKLSDQNKIYPGQKLQLPPKD